jgi:hypothetical protein
MYLIKKRFGFVISLICKDELSFCIKKKYLPPIKVMRKLSQFEFSIISQGKKELPLIMFCLWILGFFFQPKIGIEYVSPYYRFPMDRFPADQFPVFHFLVDHCPKSTVPCKHVSPSYISPNYFSPK